MSRHVLVPLLLQQRSKAEPSACRETWLCSVSWLGRNDRFVVMWILHPLPKHTILADELVESIKKAMGDKEMAANLERIHNLYLDREEKPVEKVHKLWVAKNHHHAGCLVGGVCVQTRRSWLAEVDWGRRSLLSVPPPRHHPHSHCCCFDLVNRNFLLLEDSFQVEEPSKTKMCNHASMFRCLCGKKTKIDWSIINVCVQWNSLKVFCFIICSQLKYTWNNYSTDFIL